MQPNLQPNPAIAPPWYALCMKASLAFAALVACSSVGTVVKASEYAAPVSACPGRVKIIEAVEHPTDLASVGDHAQRSAWAIGTQGQVSACVQNGTISPAYGYLLGLEVDARIVRYVFRSSTDSEERRAVLAAFDRLFIESRPTLLGTYFSHRADELRRQIERELKP